jgi:hypothetical protein
MRARVAIRLLWSALAAAAVALSAAGCGGTSATIDPFAQAAGVTSHLGGAHIAVNAQIGGGPLPQPFTLNGGGFYNYGTREGSITMDLSGLPASATAALGSGPLRIEELFKGTTIYVGSPLFAGKLPGGAHWMKLDLGRFAQAMGFNLQQLAGGQANPAQFLEYLRATGGGVTRVGSDTVRGVRTTRYRGAIDLHKVADVLPSGNRDQLRSALDKVIAQTGASSIPVEVWIDGRHVVRKMTLSFSLAAGGQNLTMHMAIELFDFGPTPSVNTPADSEVFDATHLAVSGLAGRG